MAGTDVLVKRMWSLFTTTGATATDALRTLFEEHNKTITDLETLRGGMSTLAAVLVFNPADISAGAELTQDVTVTGAALGDFVLVSFSLDVTNLSLTADVTSADTVTVILANKTGSAINLLEGNLSVRVIAAGTRATVDEASDLTAATLTTPESGD